MILTIDATGRRTGRVVARDARATPDKGAWSAYSAMRAMCPLARARGHKGIATQHYGWDRGPMFTPLSRNARARSALFLEATGSCDGWFDALQDWTVVTGCVDHDATNALK